MITQDEAISRIEGALEIARGYGTIDGAHHKMWVIDQMVRHLTGEDYPKWIIDYEIGDDPNDSEEPYEWDTGIAP